MRTLLFPDRRSDVHPKLGAKKERGRGETNEDMKDSSDFFFVVNSLSVQIFILERERERIKKGAEREEL